MKKFFVKTQIAGALAIKYKFVCPGILHQIASKIHPYSADPSCMADIEPSAILKLLAPYPGFGVLQQAMVSYPDLHFYLAGGVMRNLSPKIYPALKDVDIFVSGDGFGPFKNEIAALGHSAKTPFGSLRWAVDEGAPAFDVVHVSEMAVLKQKPSSITGALRQFDITINALALDIRTHDLYDPVGGRDDLRAGVIRAVRVDFTDDPISAACPVSPLTTLWFRMIHYASLLDFSFEHHTLQWIRENRHRFKQLELFSKCFFDPQLEKMKSI